MPGWHSTIFPPYFVAGAIFSGFAMVLTLLIPVRRVFRLDNVITERHLDNLAQDDARDRLDRHLPLHHRVLHRLVQRATYEMLPVLRSCARSGPNAASSGPACLQHRRAAAPLVAARPRRARCCSVVVSILVNVGMWSERFVIIVMSLQRDFLPSAWRGYRPTSSTSRSSSARSASSCSCSWCSCASCRSSRSPRSRRCAITSSREASTMIARAVGRIQRPPGDDLGPLRELQAQGYRAIDAYTPYPLREAEGTSSSSRGPFSLS